MERTYTLREMMEAVRRRRWLALGVAVAVLLVSAIAIAAMPDEYRADSVMQIEPHQMPPDFFPSSYTSFDERMRTLKHGVLARPVLERVLAETDFVPNWKSNPDDALEKLRRSVEVRLEGEVAGGPPSLLFVVEVRGDDRAKVAKAADLIPRYYAELTRQVMQTQAKNLSSTLSAQLGELSKRLAGEEQKLVAFKAQHALEVPEANDANQRAAATLMAQIDLRLGAIADAKRRRTAAAAAVPEAFSGAGLASGNAEDVLRRLETARATYGPDHPDVKRLERQYQEVTSRSGESQREFRKERVDGQLARIDGEVAENEAAVARLRQELEAVQKRLDTAPRLGEQYRVLSRDYETLRGKYASTLSRATDAQAAETLLAADSPTLFRVVQAAVAPSRPAGPNRLNLGLVALAAALGAALLAVAAGEYFDSSLRGPQDASAFGVPVLAAIPRIGPRRAGAQG
jgi:succinoglycan biosynthesis transport protein ExoP